MHGMNTQAAAWLWVSHIEAPNCANSCLAGVLSEVTVANRLLQW